MARLRSTDANTTSGRKLSRMGVSSTTALTQDRVQAIAYEETPALAPSSPSSLLSSVPSDFDDGYESSIAVSAASFRPVRMAAQSSAEMIASDLGTSQDPIATLPKPTLVVVLKVSWPCTRETPLSEDTIADTIALAETQQDLLEASSNSVVLVSTALSKETITITRTNAEANWISPELPSEPAPVIPTELTEDTILTALTPAEAQQNPLRTPLEPVRGVPRPFGYLLETAALPLLSPPHGPIAPSTPLDSLTAGTPNESAVQPDATRPAKLKHLEDSMHPYNQEATQPSLPTPHGTPESAPL
ncbi:hypothetical protein EJ08DRAFT_697014 [Tothia fuscella]|uniref:Uncharacterized protein n=1 Tax=Tothia fuscella TaxID=1048955 RepID=A0A9P4NSX9_9PEZI|nr:hypothetical protein EJ08DRAFT_697014 [Tothia fuscella]